MNLDSAFLERWVEPLYMEVLSSMQSPTVTQQLAVDCGAVNPEVIGILLADFNWRSRKMAALYAGINGWSCFTSDIGGLLLKSELTYAGANYCIALARFGSDEAVAYLKQYLDIWLGRPDCWYDQNHALSALLWLDQMRGTDEATIYVTAGGLWEQFVENKPNWDLERTKQRFFDTMQFCQEQFPQ